MGQTRHVWCRDLLSNLGVPGTMENALAIIAQCQAEGSPTTSKGGGAKFNPLNCTVKAPGSTNYNLVPVQNYTTWEQGIDVTAAMIRQANMKGLRAALVNGSSAEAYWRALVASPWGTHAPVGYTITSWIADVAEHWFDRAMVTIAGS